MKLKPLAKEEKIKRNPKSKQPTKKARVCARLRVREREGGLKRKLNYQATDQEASM